MSDDGTNQAVVGTPWERRNSAQATPLQTARFPLVCQSKRGVIAAVFRGGGVRPLLEWNTNGLSSSQAKSTGPYCLPPLSKVSLRRLTLPAPKGNKCLFRFSPAPTG